MMLENDDRQANDYLVRFLRDAAPLKPAVMNKGQGIGYPRLCSAYGAYNMAATTRTISAVSSGDPDFSPVANC